MPFQIIIFQVVVLIFSAIIHEYMHGWMADRQGDSTAKDLGRLTLNPISHIDLFGSVILPFLLVVSGSSFVFGWAKPVPFNPNNFRDRKYGIAKVAFAGPLGNFIVALFFGFVLRFSPLLGTNIMLVDFIAIIIYINLLLGIFNLVPIPPLDGSKVILPFLPDSWQERVLEMEKYGMILVLFFVMFGFTLIIPIVHFLFNFIVGT